MSVQVTVFRVLSERGELVAILYIYNSPIVPAKLNSKYPLGTNRDIAPKN